MPLFIEHLLYSGPRGVINQTQSLTLRSSLLSRGTGELVESPAHKVSAVGRAEAAGGPQGGPPPSLQSRRAPRRAPWRRILSKEQWGARHRFQGFGISPQVRGAEAEAGGGIRPPGKVQVGGDQSLAPGPTSSRWLGSKPESCGLPVQP